MRRSARRQETVGDEASSGRPSAGATRLGRGGLSGPRSLQPRRAAEPGSRGRRSVPAPGKATSRTGVHSAGATVSWRPTGEPDVTANAAGARHRVSGRRAARAARLVGVHLAIVGGGEVLTALGSVDFVRLETVNRVLSSRRSPPRLVRPPWARRPGRASFSAVTVDGGGFPTTSPLGSLKGPTKGVDVGGDGAIR